MALTCPNKNLKEWKDLLASVGENRAMLMWYESEGEVGYSLAAQTNIINKLDKVNSWFKQMKDTDVFWSKLQKDLQIPKEQIALLRESEGNTIEEKLINFSANYSYTIKINTAKDEFIFNEYNPETDIFEDRNYGTKNTEYYSNLTVPGGTNYTENEISTPLITPSIKGHAQFATDNGIGWFRSDDKAATKIERRNLGTFNVGKDIYTQEFNSEKIETTYYKNGKLITKEEYNKANLKEPDFKTRRILEIQSDLFQKGRDKKDLVSKKPDGSNDYIDKKFDGTYSVMNSTIGEIEGGFKTEEDANNWLYGEVSKNPNNQFLQLLNKNNNWVTFFIKSIVQDSAKKGYEKVLFPTGNTASKVEGHATLEEFKREKEARIKKIEKIIESVKLGKNFQPLQTQRGWIANISDKEYGETKYFDSKKEAIDYSTKSHENEIKTLKQELERVDTEGFAALKPIYNFYENTVTNILNKTYGKENVNVITDEYGNTWNEIELTDDNLEEFSIGSFKPLNTPKPLNNITLEELYKEEINKSDNICNFDIGK